MIGVSLIYYMFYRRRWIGKPKSIQEWKDTYQLFADFNAAMGIVIISNRIPGDGGDTFGDVG